MFGKIALIQFFLMLAMVGAGVAYFRYTEGVINGLHEDNAKLQVAVSTQEATIAAQKEAAKRQAEQTVALQQSINDAESHRRDTEDNLRKKDIAAMARADSANLERRINRATEKVFNDIKTLTRPQDRPIPSTPVTKSDATPPSTQSTPVASTPTPPSTQSTPVESHPSSSLKSPNYQPPPRPPAPAKGLTP